MLRRRPTRPAPTAPAPADGTLRVPTAGTVVALELDGVDRAWRSRVEAQNGPDLVVVAPTRPMGPPILPDPGRGVTLGWPTELGYLEAQAELTATTDQDIATWDLTVRRSALSQRRSAFRLETRLSLHLGVERPDELSATTRNLSEGGLACEVSGRPDLEAGARVSLCLELPDGEVDAAGRVVRAVPMVPDGLELGVAFEDLEKTVVERLRQYVFEEQLARRAQGVR
ncbi:flagellar brake protein [Egicoccus sp. AB-alg2]|uniref:flagellar brake protein n=1 Tax=Egicoccus sp. AB-alg2 TaxID=3242693 RepID=UPI00359D714B